MDRIVGWNSDRDDHEPLRVGLIGYGYWGSKHARVLANMHGVALMIVESQPHRLKAAERDFPGVRVERSLDDVRQELDAVVIATPPRTHAALALRAIDAGLHALVEKPFATSVADAEAVLSAANEAGVVVMSGHTYEFNAAVWKLKDIIDSGELGRILFIETSRLNLGLYQSDCNVIWDLVPHDISIVSYLLDEFPDSVSVWAQRNLAGMYEDVAYVRLGFPSVSAFVNVSWLHPRKVRSVTVVGDQKMAVLDDISDTERIRIYDKSVGLDGNAPAPSMPVTYRNGNIVSPYVEFVEPLLVQDSHFVECIRTGRRPKASGERGVEVVRVLSATDEAIRTGARVSIERSSAQRG